MWRQADYHGLRHFLCADFLRFIALNAIWPGFWRYKSKFLPNIMPHEHAEQDQIDAKCLGKKLAFWRESRRVGRRLIIVNKSIKETENLIFFFSVGSNFISLLKTKTCIFTRGYRHSWKYCIWYSFGEIKFDLEFYFTLENQNLYFHSWLPPLVKILHLVIIRWKTIRSYSEKIKYPLYLADLLHWQTNFVILST